jgi:large subunit ribosomal protein L10
LTRLKTDFFNFIPAKMPVTKAQKAEILVALENEFKTAKAVAFTGYIGLTVADIQALRRDLRAEDVKLIVAKKTLIKLAAKNAGQPEPTDEIMAGPVAVAFAHGDELAAAQGLHKFSKDHEQVQLLGGILEGELLNQATIRQLAALPNREGLIGQLVGLLASPLRGIAGVGHSVLAGFVRALAEIEKKKAAEASN